MASVAAKHKTNEGSDISPTAITLKNVHSFGAFELRRECEARGLTLPTNVNQSSLMKCLIKALLKDQEEHEKAEFERLNREQAVEKEKLAKAKAERKAAALERSRLRQEAAALALANKEDKAEKIEKIDSNAEHKEKDNRVEEQGAA